MARRQFSNLAIETTLANGIGAADSSLTVADSTGYPNVPFIIVVDPGTASEEIIQVGAKAGTTFSSLTRGADSTTAAAHSAGATVKHVYSASDMDRMFTHFHDGSDNGAYTQFRAQASGGANSVELSTSEPTEEIIVEGTIVIPSDWNTYDIEVIASASRELYIGNYGANEYYYPRLYFDGAEVRFWDQYLPSTAIDFGADVSSAKAAVVNECWMGWKNGLTVTGSRNFKWTGAINVATPNVFVYFSHAEIVCKAYRVT